MEVKRLFERLYDICMEDNDKKGISTSAGLSSRALSYLAPVGKWDLKEIRLLFAKIQYTPGDVIGGGK